MPSSEKSSLPSLSATVYRSVHVLEEAPEFYLKNVVPLQDPVRSEVMNAFRRPAIRTRSSKTQPRSWNRQAPTRLSRRQQARRIHRADVFLRRNGFHLEVEAADGWFIQGSMGRHEFRFAKILDWLRQHLKLLDAEREP